MSKLHEINTIDMKKCPSGFDALTQGWHGHNTVLEYNDHAGLKALAEITAQSSRFIANYTAMGALMEGCA